MQNFGVASESGNITELEKKIMTKINFLVPFALVEKIKAIASQHHQTQSDIIRKAIEFYLAEVEKERIAHEIREACKLYYDADKRMAAEWRSAESKV